MKQNTKMVNKTKTVVADATDGEDNNPATKMSKEQLDNIFKELKPLIKSKEDKVMLIDVISGGKPLHHLKLFHQLFKNEITINDVGDLSRLIDSDDRYASYTDVKSNKKSSRKRKLKPIPHGMQPLFSTLRIGTIVINQAK